MLRPAYRPRVRVIRPNQKKVWVWPEGACSALQDCFSTTDWDIVKQAATNNNHTDVEEYMAVTAYIKFIEDVTHKTITICANQKPWLTGDVHRFLRTRDSAYRAGDTVGLATARANLSHGIREAKQQCSKKISGHFNNTRDAESLVKRALSRINPRKAAGPDNIPGRVLKDCAEELKDVLTDIFNISLSQQLFPSFAYRTKRSTEDAISAALHPALTHRDSKDSYVQMLFLDFSSAFNTIIPQQLINKMGQLGIKTTLCKWVLDFLTDRPQSVWAGSSTFKTVMLSKGAPQGCVLSPLLFTLLTHNCVPSYNTNHIIMFADNTNVVGLITNNNEAAYRCEVSQMVQWCKYNNLFLNIEKTKEMVIDFRRRPPQYPPLTINGAAVERVSSTKFLGVHISENLTWTTNTTQLARKAQTRLYFLRKLRRAHVPPPIMGSFYRGTIESVITGCITVWY
ncbi:hypothetical protein D4764_0188360 [Takifugu flavidus]|uniref:Reverse transcriptase domain-containing protein n=1 Tax=Takifugu flavidus TaxID=433684 RepID=A0A5C6MES4_9TELE|nr:hypothetical protein D4764_0188360 [Takifugu flavidus]